MKIISTFFLLLLLSSCQKKDLIINAGVSGNTTKLLLDRIEADVLKKSPDVVIVMIGTNDMLNSKKFISYSGFERNLKTIVSKLKSNQIKVILASPPTVDSVYLFERHNRKLYTENPNQKIDSVVKIMKRVSAQENILFVDVNKKFKELDLPVHNSDPYLRNVSNSNARDGVHTTSKGNKLIATIIYNFMQEHSIAHPGDKVICFGDSITFGVGVDGSGTADGETYPAYLKDFLFSKKG